MSIDNNTWLCSQATTRPRQAIAHPNGLWRAAIPCLAFSMASFMSSWGSIGNLNLATVLAELPLHIGCLAEVLTPHAHRNSLTHRNLRFDFHRCNRAFR